MQELIKKIKNFFKRWESIEFCIFVRQLFQSRENNIRNLSKLDWSEGFYRKDIGFKVIEK